VYAVPSKSEWGDCSGDFDRMAAYNSFFGKTNEQMQRDFFRDVLSRVMELRFMPRAPFRYYMLGFCHYVMSGRFPTFASGDAAAGFLGLIEEKLIEDRAI